MQFSGDDGREAFGLKRRRTLGWGFVKSGNGMSGVLSLAGEVSVHVLTFRALLLLAKFVRIL